MDAVWPYLAAILPTILVGTLFYFLIKSMLEGDRRERLAQSGFEAEEDRRRAAAAGLPGGPRTAGRDAQGPRPRPPRTSRPIPRRNTDLYSFFTLRCFRCYRPFRASSTVLVTRF